MSTRRDFLQTFGAMGAGALGAGALTLGALPTSEAHAMTGRPALHSASPYDLTWPSRITAKHRAVFDVSTIDSGFGVARASLWGMQYMEHLGAKPSDLSTVMVLRAEAIPLAMQQGFWDAHGIGKAKQVTHPMTMQPTDRNPALLSSTRDGIPAQFDAVALDQFMKRGGIVLACDLALGEMAALVAAKDKVSESVAHERAAAALVPGIILQPSGIFAVVRAQEAGCQFVRAS